MSSRPHRTLKSVTCPSPSPLRWNLMSPWCLNSRGYSSSVTNITSTEMSIIFQPVVLGLFSSESTVHFLFSPVWSWFILEIRVEKTSSTFFKINLINDGCYIWSIVYVMQGKIKTGKSLRPYSLIEYKGFACTHMWMHTHACTCEHTHAYLLGCVRQSLTKCGFDWWYQSGSRCRKKKKPF